MPAKKKLSKKASPKKGASKKGASKKKPSVMSKLRKHSDLMKENAARRDGAYQTHPGGPIRNKRNSYGEQLVRGTVDKIHKSFRSRKK